MSDTDELVCDVDELRTLFLFDHLTDEQLAYLCERGHVEIFEPGPIYEESQDASCFFVLLDGEVSMARRVGDVDVETSRTSLRGVYAGAWAAYLGDRAPKTYIGSLRAVRRCRMYVLPADVFGPAVRDWFPMAVHLLEGLFLGNQTQQRKIAQRERLLALGSLSAGLTHELNNPAAAAVRATSSLRDRVAGMRHKLAMMAGGTYDRESFTTLTTLQEAAVERAAKAKAADLGPLEASDREDELVDWFDDHDIAGGYDLAPTFVQSGLDVHFLDDVAQAVQPGVLEAAVRWLNYTLETELLMTEIEDSTTRISTLVTQAKQYSQLDRAPYQVVDVHELLDSTLLMLSGKLGAGVTVVRDYDRSLPHVAVYAAELNQVWTNLIDNAVQAMHGQGTLTVRTRHIDDDFEVEVADTGAGISDDVLPRIFEPFFTTKNVGEGTGLGLDISWRIVVDRHHGDIKVRSKPGETVFTVRAPINVDAGAAADADAGAAADDATANPVELLED